MAGTTVGKLNALLTADSTQFAAQLNSASNNVTNFAQSLMGSLGVGLSVGGVISAIQSAVSAAEESFRVQQKLEAVLDATGNAAGFTAEQLGEYANQLSRATAIDDEAILGAEALLATFTSIRGEQFTRTIALATDLSAVMGTDVASAAQSLGKALESPADGLTKLTRMGIILDDQQKNQIKTMIESNDVAGAQGAILDAVAARVEGSAKRMKSSWAGVAVEIGNVAEALGRLGSTDGGGGMFANFLAGYLRRYAVGVDVWFGALRKTFEFHFKNIGALFDKLPNFIKFGPRRLMELLTFDPIENPPVAMLGQMGNAVKKLSADQVIAIEDLESALRKQIATFGMSASAVRLWELEQQKIPEHALHAARALAEQAEAQQYLDKIEKDGAKEREQAQRAAQQSIDNTIRSLEEQAATLGMSSSQIQVWKMQRQGANDIEIGWAQSIGESTEHMKKLIDQFTSIESTGAADVFREMQDDIAGLDDMLEAGTLSVEGYATSLKKLQETAEKSFKDMAKDIEESTRTPLEKAEKEIENLNTLFDMNLISLDTYERKLRQISDELEEVSGLNDDLRPAAMELGTAEAFSALAPRNIQSGKGDVETHKNLQQIQQLLRNIERAIEEDEPVHVAHIP